MGSRIRDLINQRAQYVAAISPLITDSQKYVIKTSEKLKIENNKAILVDEAEGDLIYNMALIFDEINTYLLIAEVSCKINPYNHKEVIFDSNDNLNDKLCTVSYIIGEKIV